jgi:hypothetical protein
MQQKIAQAERLEGENQQKLINELYEELAHARNEVYRMSIESVEALDQLVTDPNYIDEWLKNCDKSVYDSLRQQIDRNRDAWQTPRFPVKCDNCGAENKIYVTLDQSNFFD